MIIKLIISFLITITLLACSNNSDNMSTQATDDEASLPTNNEELYTFLKIVSEKESKKIPEQREAFIQNIRNGDILPIIPVSVEMTEDGHGLHFTNEIFTENLDDSQIEAFINYINLRKEGLSADNFCHQDVFKLMQDLGYYVIEDITLDNKLINSTTYNFDFCNSYRSMNN